MTIQKHKKTDEELKSMVRNAIYHNTQDMRSMVERCMIHYELAETIDGRASVGSTLYQLVEEYNKIDDALQEVFGRLKVRIDKGKFDVERKDF